MLKASASCTGKYNKTAKKLTILDNADAIKHYWTLSNDTLLVHYLTVPLVPRIQTSILSFTFQMYKQSEF